MQRWLTAIVIVAIATWTLLRTLRHGGSVVWSASWRRVDRALCRVGGLVAVVIAKGVDGLPCRPAPLCIDLCAAIIAILQGLQEMREFGVALSLLFASTSRLRNS